MPATSAVGAPSHAPRFAARRVGAVDALRGIALCMMFVYHLAFDLRFYRVFNGDFEHDPMWLGFRAIIVASFMTIVGVSIVLADRAGMSTARFMRRIGVIALAALAATLGSWLVFPSSFIYFGILHCIVLASLLAWPWRRLPMAAVGVGIAILVAGLTWSSPWFDQRAWSWLGFVTHKPVTEDFVPLAPWSAAVFIGIALGHGLLRVQHRPIGRLDAAPGWLRWLGRHSLMVYLVHQPLFLGILWLLLGH